MKKQKNLRIIIIDDNPAIHQDFKKILTSDFTEDSKLTAIENEIFGDVFASEPTLPVFEIDTASQGKEGVEKIIQAAKEHRPYALAFVDVRMPPGWDGVETIKHIWKHDPNMQVVICTAYSDYTWEETVAELGESDNLLILKKPFDSVAVRQLASALTKKWQLIQDAKHYTNSLEARVKERTATLNTSLSMMRATLESSADGILVVTNDGQIHDFNQKLTEMWQISAEELKKNDFQSLVKMLLTKIENVEEVLSHLENLGKDHEKAIIGVLKFKNNRIFEYYTQPYTLDNKTLGRVWSFSDITQRAYLEAALQFQATHDQLTGLPNRVLLVDRIKHAMDEAKKQRAMFGMLFLDLDRFKLINDSLSHEAGDEVLKIVAKNLESIINKENTLVRLGGDEFIIIINSVYQEQDLENFAKRLLETFKEKITLFGHDLLLSASIGISIYPKDSNSIDSLMRNADMAMYQAKELGGNQYQFYTEELSKENAEKLNLETELRRAISNNEFNLCYQPQFDLKSNKLVSVEALVRWNHPTKGIILPVDFIPLAEETGLIVPIGEWVLRTACKQLKTWQDRGLPNIRVAVNITTKQFRLYNFAQVVKNILDETKLEPKYLELELTENILLNNFDIIETIHEIKQLGVQLALDDFGTGYSSLNYLREIPVDRLKIDQSYVQNIDANRGDDVIIQAIITMAKSLNLEVLAEGVETQRQVDFLKSQKCKEVQGFYFSKPLTAQDCEQLLTNPEDVELTKMINKEE